MRAGFAALALILTSPLPAGADCAADIAALFQGGAMDPFERPNRREVTVARAPDGTESQTADVLWDGVTRSINCTATLCAMYVGSEMWMKPVATDVWTSAPSQLPDDPEAFARATADDMAANMTEPTCAGEVEIDGRQATKFSYRTKTNPNEFDSWWGGLYTAFIDVETGQLIRLEETETIASWAADPDPTVKVTTITYDDDIAITVPEG